MFKFVGKVEDFKKAVVKIRKFQKAHQAVYKGMLEGANNIRNWILREMRQGPKTGRTYRRWKGKKKHQASAPGEVPAVDTGELISRIMIDARSDEIEVGAEAGAPHGAMLEKGTENMEPHPFLQPALDENLPGIKRNVLAAIEKSARDAFK